MIQSVFATFLGDKLQQGNRLKQDEVSFDRYLFDNQLNKDLDHRNSDIRRYSETQTNYISDLL